MRKFIYSFVSLIVCVLVCSCSNNYYSLEEWKLEKANYNFKLKSVESPEDAKIQYGENKVATVTEDGIEKYMFMDNYLTVVWYVSTDRLFFTIKNHSKHSIKLNWDEISYVDCNGNVSRILHDGIKYSEAKTVSQPALVIPKNATITDVLIPVSNIKYVEAYAWKGWSTEKLIPWRIGKTKEFTNTKASDYVGKEIIISMPIIIENVTNEYTFTFDVTKVDFEYLHGNYNKIVYEKYHSSYVEKDKTTNSSILFGTIK
jgi:hypothetical protein